MSVASAAPVEASVQADESDVSVSVYDAYSDETDGNGYFSIYTNNTLQHDLVVNYEVEELTGEAIRDVDFVLADGTITIPAGSSYADIPYTVIDDNENEDTEQFTLILTGVSYGHLDNSTAQAEIYDDDDGSGTGTGTSSGTGTTSGTATSTGTKPLRL